MNLNGQLRKPHYQPLNQTAFTSISYNMLLFCRYILFSSVNKGKLSITICIPLAVLVYETLFSVTIQVTQKRYLGVCKSYSYCDASLFLSAVF